MSRGKGHLCVEGVRGLVGQSEDQLYAGLLSKQGTKLKPGAWFSDTEKIVLNRNRRVKPFNYERGDEENCRCDVCLGL